MAKRFTDCEIWSKDWFLDLSIKQKLLVKFLFDNCDCAGFYEVSYRTLRNCFNEEIKKEDFEGLKQIRFIDDETIFIEDFIKYQYNCEISELNSKFSVHRGILKKLNKYGIIGTLTKELPNPTYEGLQDKDKDKDINIENNNVKKIKKLDPYINPIKTFFIEEYQKVFGNKPMLSNQDCNRIVELAADNPDIKELIPIAIGRLKCINWDIGFKPTASWLLKENNFERVINGEFGKKTPFSNKKPEVKPLEPVVNTPEEQKKIAELQKQMRERFKSMNLGG